MSPHARPRSLRLPLVLFLAVVALNLAASIVWAAWRLLPWLLLALAAAAAYRIARRRPVLPSRPPKVIQGHAEPSAAGWEPTPGSDAAEVIRLRAEVEALRAERDQAQEAARAAWQASTEPGAEAPRTARDRLLRDPCSGAHPLGGTQ